MLLNIKDNQNKTLEERILEVGDEFDVSRLRNLARKSKRLFIESRGHFSDIENAFGERICIVTEDGATPSFNFIPSGYDEYVGALIQAGDRVELSEIDPSKIKILGNINAPTGCEFIYVTA